MTSHDNTAPLQPAAAPQERDADEAIATEERILKTTIESLLAQRSAGLGKLSRESARARELTSQLVAARREEDKAMLASDEAVAHALKDQKGSELATIEKLLNKPYFARVVLTEEVDSGTKTIEYKLGFAANVDCRIIDWRKAPISKLYYDYKEGDFYSETIQGKERDGQIALRNTVEIERQVLQRVTCRHGTFVRRDGAWTRADGGSGRADRAGV